MNKFLKDLPLEIEKTIFNDHFKLNLSYIKLQNILECDESTKLNISKLLPYVNYILKNKEYIEFLSKKDKIFNLIYKDHFIEKRKCFVNLPTNKSLALSWLMYLYH